MRNESILSPSRTSQHRKNCLIAISFSLGLSFCSVGVNAAASEDSWKMSFAQGETSLEQQDLKKAESNFRNALQLVQKQTKNSNSVETVMLKLAATLALEEKTSEAQSLYQKLLRRLSARYGANSTQVAPVLMALGSLQESEGDHTTAMTYYQRALNINEKNYGPYDPSVASALHRLGRAKGKAGQIKEAEGHYKQSISILSKDANAVATRQLEGVLHDYDNLLKGNDTSNRDLVRDFQEDILGEKHSSSEHFVPKVAGSAVAPPPPTSVSSVPDLGLRTTITPPPASNSQSGVSQFQKESQIQLRTTRLSNSDENSRVAGRSFMETSSDATLAPAYKVLSDSIFKENRYERGESYYKRMIAIDIDALGPNHPSVANDLNGLAQLYIAERKYADAQPLLTRAIGIYEQTYGVNNLLTVNTRTALAKVEMQLGNSDKATAIYQNMLSPGQGSLSPNSIETARMLNDLAFSAYHQGKLQEASTFYQWALASTEGAVGSNDSLYAACLRDYAQVLRGLGKTTEASLAESRADKIANAK